MSAELSDGRAAYRWSRWFSLEEVLQEPALPTTPGLYRIRRAGQEDLDYIGQSGGSLRGRLRMLRGVFGPEMPYRDPHTAAPGLWALLQTEPCSFEVSVTEVEGDPPWRKGSRL